MSKTKNERENQHKKIHILKDHYYNCFFMLIMSVFYAKFNFKSAVECILLNTVNTFKQKFSLQDTNFKKKL